MIVEKIDDNENTMRLSRMAQEIDQVFNVLSSMADEGIYLCIENEHTSEMVIGDRRVDYHSATMEPIPDVTGAVYEAFGIDPIALRKEAEARRRKHVAVHGEGG